MLKDKFNRFCSIFEDQSAESSDYFFWTISFFIAAIISFYHICPSEYRFNNIWFLLQMILYIMFLILFVCTEKRSAEPISAFKINKVIIRNCCQKFAQSYVIMSFCINVFAYFFKFSSLVITPIYIMIPFIITIICGLISFIGFWINERKTTIFINLMSPFLDDYPKDEKLMERIFVFELVLYIIYAKVIYLVYKTFHFEIVLMEFFMIIYILKFSVSFYGCVLDLYSTIKNKHFIKNPMLRGENYQDLIRETQIYYVSHFNFFIKRSEIRDNEELNLSSIKDLDLRLKFFFTSYPNRNRREIGIEVAVFNTLDEDILMFYDEKDLEIFESSDYLSNKECGTFNGMKYIVIKPDDNLQFQARFEGDICYLDVDDTLELKYLGFSEIEKYYNEILEEEYFN